MVIFLTHSCLRMCGLIFKSNPGSQQTNSPVPYTDSFKNLRENLVAVLIFPLLWRDQQKETAVSDSLVKTQIILDQFINKADVSPVPKWHLSHFSFRWVCEWCLQSSILREPGGGWGSQRDMDTLGSLLLNLLICYLTPVRDFHILQKIYAFLIQRWKQNFCSISGLTPISTTKHRKKINAFD